MFDTARQGQVMIRRLAKMLGLASTNLEAGQPAQPDSKPVLTPEQQAKMERFHNWGVTR